MKLDRNVAIVAGLVLVVLIAFRAVSRAELDDLAVNGFRAGANSYEGKLFASSADDAAFFARDVLYPLAGQVSEFVKVEVPASFASKLFSFTADGKAAISVGPELLDELNEVGKVTVLNSIPLP